MNCERDLAGIDAQLVGEADVAGVVAVVVDAVRVVARDPEARLIQWARSIDAGTGAGGC